MTKRATRYRMEFVDANGLVVFEALVHDRPNHTITAALAARGITVRRASQPKVSGPLAMTYSELDPTNSITAAREHAARHETQLSNALMLLIDRAPDWVDRETMRKVAGDQGDRRVRELRDRNWPVETRQLTPGQPWHVRLLLPTVRTYGGDGQPRDEVLFTPKGTLLTEERMAELADEAERGWTEPTLFGDDD